MKNITQLAAAVMLISSFTALPSIVRAEVTANATVASNYVWRGLTQTDNEAAIQGGIDYVHDSGFYAGTWVSNVNFGADDFSYEHDLYFGFSGEASALGYDVGYLYYNYDADGNGGWDFGEIYGTLSLGDFEASLFILANTQGDEPAGRDWGFGEAYYLSLDYSMTVGSNGTELGFHAGHHEGDFAEDFNSVEDAYQDYNISLSNGGFSFMISYADIEDDWGAGGDFQNDEVRFVASYSLDFEL